MWDFPCCRPARVDAEGDGWAFPGETPARVDAQGAGGPSRVGARPWWTPRGWVGLEGSDTIQQINAMVVGMNGKQLNYKDLVV